MGQVLGLMVASTLLKSLLLLSKLVSHEMSRGWGEPVFQYEVTAVLVQERQDIAIAVT